MKRANLTFSKFAFLGLLISMASANAAEESQRQAISGDFNGDGYLDRASASTFGENEWRLVVHLDVLACEVRIATQVASGS
jgi:hypothetical protein